MDLEALKAEVSVGEVHPLDPDHIIRDLQRLESQLHGPGGAAPGMHLITLNLLVACSGPEQAKGVGRELAELSSEFPCRALVAVFDPAAEDGGLQGWASAANHPTRRSQVCCEQVGLYSPGALSGRVPSLVLATMHPDLPTLLYWRGDPPFGGELLEQMVEPTNRVVFDSRAFGGSWKMAEILSLLNDRYHQEQAFSDLAWGSLDAWREETASLFDAPEALVCLPDLETVEVGYRPAGDGLPPLPLLFAGWLASRLRWTGPGLAAAAGGYGTTLRGGSGSLALSLVARPERDDLAPGDLASFRCRTAGGREFQVTSVRERRRPHRESRAGHPLSAAARRQVDLLGRELSVFSRDPIYQEALQAAVDLLPAREAVQA